MLRHFQANTRRPNCCTILVRIPGYPIQSPMKQENNESIYAVLLDKKGLLMTAGGIVLLVRGFRHIRQSTVMALTELAAGTYLLAKGIVHYSDTITSDTPASLNSNKVVLDITV